MGLYLYLIFDRNDITSMQRHNKDIEEIVLKTRFKSLENDNVIMFEEIDFVSYTKVLDFIKLMDVNLLMSDTVQIANELDSTSVRNATLFYLVNPNNYVVLQGSSYCVSVVETDSFT